MATRNQRRLNDPTDILYIALLLRCFGSNSIPSGSCFLSIIPFLLSIYTTIAILQCRRRRRLLVQANFATKDGRKC